MLQENSLICVVIVDSPINGSVLWCLSIISDNKKDINLFVLISSPFIINTKSSSYDCK